MATSNAVTFLGPQVFGLDKNAAHDFSHLLAWIVCQEPVHGFIPASPSMARGFVKEAAGSELCAVDSWLKIIACCHMPLLQRPQSWKQRISSPELYHKQSQLHGSSWYLLSP